MDERQVAGSAMGLDPLVVAAVLVGGAVTVLVALALPWATFHDRGLGATIEMDGGTTGRVLVGALAVFVMGLAAIRARHPKAGPTLAQAGASFALLAAVVALALHAIATANDLTSPFPGQTAYGPGSVIGGLGALAAAAASGLALLDGWSAGSHPLG